MLVMGVGVWLVSCFVSCVVSGRCRAGIWLASGRCSAGIAVGVVVGVVVGVGWCLFGVGGSRSTL